MDIIVTILLSAMAPLFLNYSDIAYTPRVGVFVSPNDQISSFTVKPITTGNKSDYSVVSSSYTGPYLLDYDAFWENKISIFRSNWWIGSRSSWSPLRHQITAVLKSDASINSSTKAVYFSEEIASGLLTGYDLHWKNSLLTFSPYVGGLFMRVGYEGYSAYESQINHSSSLKLFAGVDAQVDENWHVLAEVSQYNASIIGITDNAQDLDITVRKYKIGISYSFENLLAKRNSNRNVTYDAVIDAMDPQLDDRKDVLEEKIKAEAAKKKAEAAKKKAEAEKEKAVEKKGKDDAKADSASSDVAPKKGDLKVNKSTVTNDGDNDSYNEESDSSSGADDWS